MGSLFDLSNSKMLLTGSTAPTPFSIGDVTQTTDYSNNQVILSGQHKDLVGTLDISAISVYYSGKYGSSSQTTISPNSVNLINLDGTNHLYTVSRAGDGV